MKKGFIICYLASSRRLLRYTDKATAKKRREFFLKNDKIDFYQVPIFIISFNRLTYLKKLINKLRQMGYKNINIIDNDSSYKPLLEYYETTDCKVFRMDKNYGHMVFWKREMFENYRKSLYVVTDPDIMPVESCPKDFIEAFYRLLKKYPRIKKVGFSLKIDDIPEDAPLYNDVIEWEKRFYYLKIPFENAYASDIDTTFALYLPDGLDSSRNCLSAIRTGAPYQARHLPWYRKKKDVSEEEIYYAENRSNGFWDEVSGKRTENLE